MTDLVGIVKLSKSDLEHSGCLRNRLGTKNGIDKLGMRMGNYKYNHCFKYNDEISMASTSERLAESALPIIAISAFISIFWCLSPTYLLSTASAKSISSNSGLIALRASSIAPRWVSRVPKRGFGGWIDREKGIYRTSGGDVIGPYKALHDAVSHNPSWIPSKLKGKKINTHHIVEKRFAKVFGFNEPEMPAVLVSKQEHIFKGGIHSEIRKMLPFARGGSYEKYKEKKARIQKTYQEFYSRKDASRQDWLGAIDALMSDWHSR